MSMAVSILLGANSFAQNPNHSAPQIKWLGVSVENLSEALRSQLGSTIKTEVGVLIKSIQPNSPAAKAGLRTHDILMSINGKPILSSNQLYQLVQQSNANENVSLEIIRKGEYQTLNANIGVRNAPTNRPHSPFNQPFSGFNHPFFNSQPNWNQPFFQQPFGQGWPGFSMPQFPNIPKNLQGKTQSWSQSESLSVRTLANGKIKAELKTKDNDNNERNYVYEGTRDSIINQIKNEKDMSQNHKDQLLGALQGNSSQSFGNSFNHFFNHTHPNFPNFPSFNTPWQQPQQKPLIQQQNRAIY